MMQQINLYRSDLFEKKIRFPARVLAWILGGGVVVMLLISLILRLQVGKIGRDLEAIEATASSQTERLATIQKEYPPARKDLELERRVQLLQSQREQKNRILQAMESREVGNSSGFSAYLEGLARRDLPGTWLRRIVIDQGGRELVLEGSALSPEMTPQLIQNLGKEEIFAGLEFSHLTLSSAAGDHNRIDFLLATTGDKKQE